MYTYVTFLLLLQDFDGDHHVLLQYMYRSPCSTPVHVQASPTNTICSLNNFFFIHVMTIFVSSDKRTNYSCWLPADELHDYVKGMHRYIRVLEDDNNTRLKRNTKRIIQCQSTFIYMDSTTCTHLERTRSGTLEVPGSKKREKNKIMLQIQASCSFTYLTQFTHPSL